MDFIFYVTLLCLIFIFGTLDTSIDYDFWARLIVGKNFIQTGSLFRNDFLSYGTTHEFIDHEWGSGVLFYIVQHHLGDIGLFLFKSLIIFLTFYIITKIIRLQNDKIKLHFLFFFFVIHSVCYSIFSTIRCQSFSFLFFVLYLYILKYVQKTKNYRLLYTLPLFNIVWANLHGGFSIGIILILLFAIGEFLNKNQCKHYFYSLFAVCLTTLINPYGIKYVFFIIDALSINRIHITEWQSAFFNNLYFFSLIKFKLFFAAVIALFIYSAIKNIKLNGIKEFYIKTDKTKYLILLFTMLIALKSLRFHVFFSYSVLALCYCDFYNIFSRKLSQKADNIKEIILFALVFISCISHIINWGGINKLSSGQYPYEAVEFIKINNLKGNVFGNFHTGSYLAYKLYPNNRIFMDGRYEEVYDKDLINEMAKVFMASDYKGVLNKYHTDILILDKTYPIVNVLKQDKNYFTAYEDKYYSLFLDSKYKNKKFLLPVNDMNYYNKTKFDTDINRYK